MIFSILDGMKKHNLIFALLILVGINLQAQKSIRIGYVDMEYILENVPEYQEAAAQLDVRVKEWKTEAEENTRELEALKVQLDNERALLTKELIEERQEEIAYREQQAVEYQQDRFGPKGDYMMQKRQLVKPIQDQVFAAVQEIAKNRGLDFIFDRTSEIGMVYASEQHNVSDQVLRSISRASQRSQVNSKDDEEELEKAEKRTVEQDIEIAKKEKVAEDRKSDRERILEEKRKERDSLKELRQREFENRRMKILEGRQKKKDSIEAARKLKETDN